MLQGHISDSQSTWCPPAPHGPFLLQLVSPQSTGARIYYSQGGRTLHVPLSNCRRFLPAHFTSLLQSLWMAAQASSVSTISPGFISTNLLKVHFALLPRSLMKMLNNICPTVTPWCTQEIGFQLHFVPLHICFLPVLIDLCQSRQTFSDDLEGPCSDTGQLCQHSWVQHIRSQGLVPVQSA